MVDNNIIVQILNGDKNHYSFLMDKYHNELFKYIYNITGSYDLTEDLLQEVFIKIYNNLKKFNSEKASFRTWIYKIASNHTINHLKSKQHQNLYQTDLYEEGTNASSDDIEESIVKEEQLNNVVTVMKRVLKTKHLKIMMLHYFSNLTVNEISETMDIPTKTIYKALKSSVEKIRLEVNIDG